MERVCYGRKKGRKVEVQKEGGRVVPHGELRGVLCYEVHASRKLHIG